MIYTISFSPIIGQHSPFPLALINAPGFLPESLSRFLFESHWFLWIALALIGIVLFVVALRGQDKLRPYALGVFTLVILWVLAAFIFDTRYERLYASAQRLLNATIQQNPDAVLAELDDDFSFGEIKKPQVAKFLRGGLPALAISKHTVMLFDQTPGDPDTLVHLNIITAFGKEGNLLTRWELLYKEEPDGSLKIHSVAGWKIGDEAQKLDFPQIPGF